MQTTNVNGKGMGVVVVFLVFAIAALALIIYYSPWLNGSTSQTSSTSVVEGVVTGYVAVGPSQPVCQANQSCNVDVSNYSLIFTPQCSGSCNPVLAQLSPSGHYSVLLPEGTYTVSGLSPSCPWLGCSTTFPVEVTVVGGMQLVQDFSVDTGIR